ncbi:hypothetical protein OSB04_025125 [Centaurea solstitialis]|uniref:Endonuclease/exonuclease/phosphatase domain-containing protein n=1 Tax=Centaurea solstitialis TaxID=347529 RepID=A0AA38SV31_9ASTR|nr:hypothetical protein OSB04_025125 [Centaurea solstitialis]
MKRMLSCSCKSKHGRRRNPKCPHLNSLGDVEGDAFFTDEEEDEGLMGIRIRREVLLMIKLLSLNVNGLSSDFKRNWIRSLGKEFSCYFVCLQESHLQSVDHRIINSCWGIRAVDFAFAGSSGRSGGLITFWDPSHFVLESSFHGQNFLVVKGKWRSNNLNCLIVNVYAPNDPPGRAQLWDTLSELVGENPNAGWVFCGDFNEVLSTGLVEPNMGGRRFTWSNAEGTKFSKIDRIFLSAGFLSRWPNPSVIALPRLYSDHNPLFLDTGKIDFGPVPFRFFNSWLIMDDLSAVVNSCWSNSDSENSSQSGIHRLFLKLKSTKMAIKDWRVPVRERNTKLLIDLKTKLNSLDLSEELGDLDPLEREEKEFIVGKIKEMEQADLADVKQRRKLDG